MTTLDLTIVIPTYKEKDISLDSKKVYELFNMQKDRMLTL